MTRLALVLVVSAALLAISKDSADAQQLESKVYWMATITVPIGKLTEYHTFAEKELMPLQAKHGYKFVAAWQTIVGDIEEVVVVAEFESMAVYHKARMGLLASSEWKATSARLDTFTRDQHTRFMSATPYSPIK
jgi:NIPSNAP